MATTVTTIDKGDLICWVVQNTNGYTVWDEGVLQETCSSDSAWTTIKFKRLGLTNWEVKSIVMVPISDLMFDGVSLTLEERLRKQGSTCWCVRFKEMD